MSVTDPNRAAAAVIGAVDGVRAQLLRLSHAIHADPEVSWQEHRAAGRITALLAAHGFSVESPAFGLPTAFAATSGSGSLTVAVCAEYDALPGVGHACGHNIIAAAAAGAAIALAGVADELDLTVRVLGTPAEEHGGGKVTMLDRGAWDDVAAAVMVHPAPDDRWPTATVMQAVHRSRVTFTGRSAHAAAAPHEARNAADAATVALVALGLLRQQVRDGARFNAIVREAGEVTNVIAATAVVDIEVREATATALRELEERVMACFAGAATATGTTVVIEETEPLYAQLTQDPWLAERCGQRLIDLGRAVSAHDEPRSGGSTDMGNVSQVVPSIHPNIGVTGALGPIHSAPFALAAASAAGDEAVMDGAKALALTVVDLACDAEQRARVLAALRSRTEGREA